ncbi:MAG: hypothetical protein WC702_03560 [Patescibacteria group bacterium]|jgi:hypothetical protein
MIRSILAALAAAIIAFFASTSALAATAAELGACKEAVDPIDCYLTLKQACVGDDQDCIQTVDLAWAQWRADAAEAKLAVAAKPASVPEPVPVIRPMPPAFPVGGVQAPEMMDPPLRAFSYNPLGLVRWLQCDHCATIQLDRGRTYTVAGPEGIVPVIDRFGRVRTVVGNFNGDDRVSEVEMSGTPVTWSGEGTIWLIGTPGASSNFVLREVTESRPGYWLVDSGEITRRIFGDLPGPQELSVPPSF